MYPGDTECMTNQRFTYRKGSGHLVVDVYLTARDTFLGSLARTRRGYNLIDANGNDLGESAISRDTAAGALYAAACDAERERMRPAWMPSAEQKQRADDAHEAIVAERKAIHERALQLVAENGATLTEATEQARYEADHNLLGSSLKQSAFAYEATVTDNHGNSYTARALKPGDAYGNGATWGSVFYQRGRLGITIDGLPSTYYAATIADDDHELPLAIDFDAGWFLTPESTARFVQLAKDAMSTAGARGLS